MAHKPWITAGFVTVSAVHEKGMQNDYCSVADFKCITVFDMLAIVLSFC